MGEIIFKEVVKPTYQNVWALLTEQQPNCEISGSCFSHHLQSLTSLIQTANTLTNGFFHNPTYTLCNLKAKGYINSMKTQTSC